MRIAAFLCFVVMGVSSAFAQYSAAPAPLPSPAVKPAAAPVPYPVMPSVRASAPLGATARLEHLLEAAVHLEVAGESGQAQQVRRLVAQEREALLSRLPDRAPTEANKQVLIELRVIEFSRSKLKKMGFDWATVLGDGIARPLNAQQFSVLNDNKALLAMLEALCKDKLARVLAEPTLVGMSGRPMGFHSGGEYPVKPASGQEEPVEYGVRADFVPLVLGADRLRLDMRVVITEPLEAIPGKPHFPKVRTRSIDTGVEMESGKTCVISGLTSQIGKSGDEPAETIEMLLLVTPQIVEGMSNPE